MADDEIRMAAIGFAVKMHDQGAANTTGNNQDDDLIRLAERIFDFIKSGTVPGGS